MHFQSEVEEEEGKRNQCRSSSTSDNAYKHDGTGMSTDSNTHSHALNVLLSPLLL